jgi:hypothetical protein
VRIALSNEVLEEIGSIVADAHCHREDVFRSIAA